MIKRLLRPPYYFYRKYFSEVGYVTRFFNLQLSRLLGRAMIRQRRELARNSILPTQVQSLLEQLHVTGGIKAHLHQFGIPGEVLTVLQRKAAAFGNPGAEEIKKTRAGMSKTYWTDIFDQEDPDYAPIVELACNKNVLAFAAAYLGEAPTLQDITFYYSPPGESNRLVGSQGWHLDNEQRTKLKLFLSPYEMTLANGPTTYLPLPYSRHALYKNYPNYFDDAQAGQFGLDIAHRVPMTAAPGEFYLADTSRVFHYGARSQTQARWILIVTYGPVEHHLFPSGWKKFYAPESKFYALNQRILQQLSAA